MDKYLVTLSAPTYSFIDGECVIELRNNHGNREVAEAVAEHLTKQGYTTDGPTIYSAEEAGYGTLNVEPVEDKQ